METCEVGGSGGDRSSSWPHLRGVAGTDGGDCGAVVTLYVLHVLHVVHVLHTAVAVDALHAGLQLYVQGQFLLGPVVREGGGGARRQGGGWCYLGGQLESEEELGRTNKNNGETRT